MSAKDAASTPTNERERHAVEDSRDVETNDIDAAGAALSVPDTGETGEGGKLKMIVQLLKRCLGVKDLAAMRLSLPASLLEPIPNLEYWQYLDRPDLFAAINDSDDPFERMLAAIRFAFTKDLKFIRGKVVKPYNSVLGEHFRAHWDVLPVHYPSDPTLPPSPRSHTSSPAPSIKGTQSESGSMLSLFSGRGATAPRAHSINFVPKPSPLKSLAGPSSPTPSAPAQVESNRDAQVSNLSLGGASTSGSFADTDSLGDGGASTDSTSLNVATGAGAVDVDADDGETVRIAFLTEQISHHPPISAYCAACPSRGLELTGVDQIAARVSGMGVRVAPGTANKGIFVRITGGAGEGELYQITHPVAAVNGMLKGNMYVTVMDSTIITCSGGKGDERLRAIIEYKDESWLGNPKFSVEGVIHTYNPKSSTHEEWTKVKHVPQSQVIAQFDGSWRHLIRWKRSSSPNTEYAPLIDLSTLLIVPKRVRPLAHQAPTESRKLWENVTSRLIAKEFGEATKHKHAIEQRQRDRAAERKKKGEEFLPVFFERNIDTGVPTLTAEGRKALEDELNVKEAGP